MDDRGDNQSGQERAGLPVQLACDLLACLRFYSRLPVPVFAFEPSPHGMLDFTHAVRILPLAGAIIALPACAMIGLATAVGLPAPVTAGLALAIFVLATGAFHEDGLADTADGFGGGSTRERKLEIMKDSRVGTYGAIALVLATGLRWVCLWEILLRLGAAGAVLVLIAAAAASRTAALWPLAVLPPARNDGAAWAAGKPDVAALAMAALWCAALSLPLYALQHSAHATISLLIAAAAAGWAIARLARRQIGGQTGDVAGAAQQIAEIATYLAVLIATGR
ncbi:MAG: adenosylcobinamide-GDP ribazoletransferase [Beijerinckiaceae bacterium]